MDQVDAVDAGSATPAASQFLLQARRDLRTVFAYLQARERADYYQAIVRVFLKNARRYYKIYLTIEQVAAEIATVYQDYSLDKCRDDLDQLEVWGNVVKTFDTAQRHSTIESFLHPTVLYRASPATLEIEETFLRLEEQTETVGELRRGDLDHLLDLFEEVDKLVNTAPAADGAEDPQRARVRRQALAETWRRLADHARTIPDNTSRYIQTLAIARQEAASSEIEGYVRYKQQVVEYVQDFAMALERVSAQLQRRFRTWEANGGQERILVALAEYHAPSLRILEIDERRREATSQLGAVADWFRGPEWAEYFGKAARHEVNSVLQRAQLLAATANLGAGLLTDLDVFARQLLRMNEVEAAARAMAVAFAHPIPRLLPEHLSAHQADVRDPWADDAPVRLTLQPIQRGGSSTPHETPPIRDRQAVEALRQAELDRRQDRLTRLDRLFGTGEQTISALALSDDEDARLAIEVVRRCLLDVDHRWRVEDGTTISMRNPEERRLAILRGPRGSYVLPRYVLSRAGRMGRASEIAREVDRAVP